VCIWKVLRPATSIKDFLPTADAQFHCMLLMQPSLELTSKFSPQCNPANVMKTPSHCCFPNTSLTPNAPFLCSAARCHQSNSQHAALFTAQSCTSLPLLGGGLAVLPRTLVSSTLFPISCNNVTSPLYMGSVSFWGTWSPTSFRSFFGMRFFLNWGRVGAVVFTYSMCSWNCLAARARFSLEHGRPVSSVFPFPTNWVR
jgi:hypothetical protein